MSRGKEGKTIAVIRIDLQSENRASREVLRLRGEINNLSETIARNNQRTAAGTAAERAKTAETNRGLRAQQMLLRAQQNRQAIALAGLRQESGLLAQNRRQTELLTRVTRGLGSAFGVVAGVGLGTVLLDITRSSVQASVRVEGFRRSLTALYGDAQIAEGELDRLRETAQLPGITFEGAVQGAIRLKTVGREGADAEAIIREFSNANALAGGTTAEFGRAMVGLTQILSRGKLSQEELNQVLEAVPLIGNSIREAFGSIDAETIRDTLDAAGQDVNDFVDILVNQLSMGARASADSTANAFSNLGNATFELSAAIGDSLAPAVRDATTFLTGLLGGITDFIEGNQFGRRSAEEFAEAISGTTQSVRELLPELDEYIRNLERQQRSRGGISSEQLASLNEARDLYNLVNGAIAGNADAIQELETRTQSAKDALDAANTEQERLKAAIDAVDPSIRSERDSLQGLNADLAENTQRVQEAQTEYDSLNRVLSATQQETTALIEGVSALEAPTATARIGIGELRSETQDLSASIRTLPPEITAVRTEFDVLAPTTERVNAIFDQLNTSLVDTGAETTAFAQIYRELQTQITSYAADQAIANAEVRLVSPAVTDAANSMRDYVDVMDDVGVRFRDIEGVSEDVTNAVRDQESAFDDLRDAADAAEISLDDIDDTFSRIPDAIDPSIVSMEDFETVALRALRDIGDELSAFEGNLGAVGTAVDNLVTLFANPINFAAGTLGAVIEGLSTLEDFAGPLGLPEGFFDDPAPGQAQVNPRNIRSAQDQEAQQTHLAGIARYLDTPGGGEFLRANAPELLQRPGTREFVEQNYPELVDILYPRGQGFNQSGALAGRRRAQSLAERTGTDRQAIEDVAREQYGAADYAAEVAAATGEALQGSVEPPDIAEIEADQPQSTERETRDQARAAEQMRRDEERRQRDAQREAQRETRDQARAAEQMRRDEERRQRDAQREAQRETRDQARAEERARAEAARAAEREAEQVARAEQDRLRATERERQEAARAAERAEAERIRAAERAADAQERAERDRLRAAEREAEQVARAEQDRLRTAERAEAEQRRTAERAERDRLRATERTQQIAEQEERDRLRAAEREERERTQLIEREQRERQRLAERQQREAERANEQRLREEMRTQDRIDGLRDDAFESEQDRLMRLEDINEDHQQRLEDIERDGLRRRQELQREFGRDTQDIFQEAREQIADILIDEGVGAGDINRFLSGIEGNVPSQISESGLSQIRNLQRQRLESQLELQRQRDRALEDLGFREGQQREDAGLRQAQSAQEVNERARAETLRIERETAALQSTTAMTEATTAQTTSETAVTESANATMMSESIGVFSEGSDTLNTVGDRLFEAGDHIIEGISGSGLMDAASALQTVAENFHVLVTGNSADVRRLPAGSAPPVLPPTVTQPAPTTPQGNQMAVINMEFPDGTIKELRGQIVQQQQDGRGL